MKIQALLKSSTNIIFEVLHIFLSYIQALLKSSTNIIFEVLHIFLKLHTWCQYQLKIEPWSAVCYWGGKKKIFFSFRHT